MIDTQKIIEKYYSRDTDIYYILLIHSEQVRDKALKIARHNTNLRLDLEFIEEASLLHDIGIFKCNAPRIHCSGKHEYIEHGYLGAELLRKEGLPRHALVCERHTGVGLTAEMIQRKKIPLPPRDFVPVSLEEQLICYADKFYSKTKLNEEHSVDQILTFLQQFGDEEVEKFKEWQHLFGE